MKKIWTKIKIWYLGFEIQNANDSLYRYHLSHTEAQILARDILKMKNKINILKDHLAKTEKIE